MKLSDWLVAAKHRFFVGREAELELFRQWLLSDEPSFNVLYVYAPGGVGKTTLLHEFAHLAAQRDVPVCWIDGRTVPQPSPEGFLNALYLASGYTMPDDLAHCLLLVDTFEDLAPLHGWFRERFLPGLARQCRVVVAGRTLPDPEWRTDVSWRDLIRIVSLRNLQPDESRTLLAKLGVPPELHDQAVASTHGHPLALALIADLVASGSTSESLTLERAPDVVRVLVERFARDVPSARHRQALEICAHTLVTTESLLAEVLGPDEGHEAFAWLRGLSFIEHGRDGIFPHDLVREVLDADLRWRNPQAYWHMHRQVRAYIVRRSREAARFERQRAYFELLYLHRNHPVMKPYFEWASMGRAYAEPAGPDDHADILDMVRHHEGAESAHIAAYWLRRQPHAFVVFRDTVGRQPIGFAASLTLSSPTPEDIQTDPAVHSAWEYVQRYGPLRTGECLLHHRFWMGRDRYQDPSIHNLVANVCLGLWLTVPHLAWTFPSGAAPDFWEPMFSYLNFHRAVDADFRVGDRRYGVFAHDWRIEPPHIWLETMGEREIDLDFRPDSAGLAAPAPLVVLSQPEFAAAVRQALRDYTRPDALADNPLLRSRVVRFRSGSTHGPEALQEVLDEAVATLRAGPKDEKLYRALYHTYYKPAPTQEAAAERLDLPFSTYRFHLSRGIARVTEWLWRRELYGPDVAATNA